MKIIIESPTGKDFCTMQSDDLKVRTGSELLLALTTVWDELVSPDPEMMPDADASALLRKIADAVDARGARKPMTFRTGVVDVTVPAGEYWLGDPCYSVKGDHWHDWLHAAYKNNSNDGNLRGHLVAQLPGGYWAMGMSTAHGDGCYADNEGNFYGVDAGLIGLVPVAYNPTTNYKLNAKGKNEYGAEIARKVTFTKDTRCGERAGTLYFGDDIRIETA